MVTTAKRVLWVDDEVELLQPHLLFLKERGYAVDTATNGDDALVLNQRRPYDLVLLDEQMPGRRGLDVLSDLRRQDPAARVVLVTKSEDDRTLHEAVGRRVDGYLVKPVSPRQVLSVLTDLLHGARLQQEQSAREFAGRFPQLYLQQQEARDWKDYFELYGELVDWELRLEDTGEGGLQETVHGIMTDMRREFGELVVRSYGGWTAGQENRPPLSTDIVGRYLMPRVGREPVLFVILDCMRLDQWRALRPMLALDFEVQEDQYASVLPTATPYARNALFSGRFPESIERHHPGWWGTDEGSLNSFEDQLLSEQLRRLSGRDVPVHYEKVFSDAQADDLLGRVRGAIKQGGVIALVFSFVDLLTHGRSESPVLMEVARDASALRGLTRQWFERSAVARILEDAAARGITAIVTTDHGSILCQRPVTVYARRDATSSLRYKFGVDLRADEPSAVFAVNDERILRFPRGRMATNYVIAREDYFFVYPTKLREYQARYRGSFLHGGISPEEMILPVAVLEPR